MAALSCDDNQKMSPGIPSHRQRSVTSNSLRPYWTVACQGPLFTGLSRQDYWSGLPFPPPRDLPDPGIEPTSPKSPVLAGEFFTTDSPGKPGITWGGAKIAP